VGEHVWESLGHGENRYIAAELAGPASCLHSVTIDADPPIVFHHSLVWLLHTAQATALTCRHRPPQIDFEDHNESPTIVAQVNDDNLAVPTVLFRDGSALTNPSAAKSAASSYRSATRPSRASGVVLAGE
jgi:hypothetical protein